MKSKLGLGNLVSKSEFGFRELLRAEDSTESVAIVDIIVIEVGTAVIAGYPRIVLVVLLGKPLSRYYSCSRPILA